MKEALLNAFTLTGGMWLAITLVSYLFGLYVHRRLHSHPLSHPLITTAVLVGVCLYAASVPVPDYQQYAGILHWLLGPVTVALALPIYRQWRQLHLYGWRLAVSIAFGGVLAPALAWLAVYFFDAPLAIQFTMLAKSITTPLAMETSAQIGGIPPLAAVFVIVTGVVGAIFASGIFTLLNVTNRQAQGIALGTVAHAVGTAKAIHMGDDVAAMATLGLCVNGIFTAIVLPLIFTLAA
ncbi:LrgB family protein [Alteromonas sp. D210916BOD_24]|uniref:LrgB family protein n=1 Tax=Alteromonas sp. D210916BOD_24 TaxID=3157618 RepID=UPI00399CFCCC